MSDESDKTVFRPPSSSDGDRTVIRPTPGRRGAAQQPPSQPFQQPPPVQQQTPPPAYAAPQAPPQQAAPGYTGSESFSIDRGLNPLVNAAATLLAVFDKTRHALSHPDVGGLHQRLVAEIKNFETKAKNQGIKPEVVLAARYVLCTALDEAVLNTPWGSESAWTQRTLLSVFHNETAGGEKFFAILDRMRETPADNLYILELMYLLISLGFEGKYKVVHRGREALEQIRDELFQIIRNYRGEYERQLSPSWQGLGRIKNTLSEYIPMWVVASVVGAVLILGYSGFRFWMYKSSEPVVSQLNQIVQLKANDKPKPIKQSVDF